MTAFLRASRRWGMAHNCLAPTVWICPWPISNLIPLCLSAWNSGLFRPFFVFLSALIFKEICLSGNPLKTPRPSTPSVYLFIHLGLVGGTCFTQKSHLLSIPEEAFVYWAFPNIFMFIIFIFVCRFGRPVSNVLPVQHVFISWFCIGWLSKVYLCCNSPFKMKSSNQLCYQLFINDEQWTCKFLL